MWQAIVDQNAALVCFKEGSDEIVGINMNFVSLKDDHFMEEIRKRVNHNRTKPLMCFKVN